ncbi:MAG: hypothetical protein LBE13_08160 [Bacteroidales bacterium]|jgi:hypothetical protein|nr:hypothetical protein [Bacteroidales bacterium]
MKNFLVIVLLGAVTLMGCGGGSSNGDNNDNSNSNNDNDNDNDVFTPAYSVNFYNTNLDLINSKKIKISSDNDTVSINIPELKAEFNIIETLHRNSSSEDVSNIVDYNITGNINFYTISDIKEITTQSELAYINTNVNTLAGKYMLMKDINLTEGEAGFEDAEKGWKPIGNNLRTNYFKGIFNGNGHKIANLWINRTSEDYVGLFGYIYTSNIKNLGVEINEGKSINGNDNVGGIAGYAYKSNIIKSYSAGNVSGNSQVGGIVGYATRSSIEDVYSTGNINGNSYIGGIAGNLNTNAIIRSYSAGNISGNSQVGGIVGYVGISAIVHNSMAINPSIIGATDVSRIVGYANDDASIANNFARTGLVNSNFKIANVNFGISTNDDEFLSQKIYTRVIWRFGRDDANPWQIDENAGYPYFYWEKR